MTANDTYHVLVNDEGQYSLWPSPVVIPPGWTCVKLAAPKEECLRYIENAWTDMRPRSIRSIG